MRNVLTPKEVGEELRMSEQRVRDLIHAGKLKACDASAGTRRATWLIHRTDLDEFLRPHAKLIANDTNARLSARRRRLDANVPKVI